MEDLPWFQTLPAAERADVGLVVEAGVGAFTAWLRDPSAATPGPEIFGAAPRELARSVTLKHTVQLIRISVEVFEDEVPQLAPPGGADELMAQVLRYSRELAFAAAEVYAAAAEARGAWDARIEAGVVEALVRGEVGELAVTRAGSLGWGPSDWVVAIAGRLPGPPPEQAAILRAEAHHRGWSMLLGEAGGTLLVFVGGRGAPCGEQAADLIAGTLVDGPVVIGPCVPDLVAAATATAEVLAALAAVAGWPQAPRPVQAGALLPERVVLGDQIARARLLEEVHSPLLAARNDLLETAAAFLDGGGSIEGTGRALFLHPNTVRYRLKKVTEATGLDLTQPRDAQAARLALVLGRTTQGATPA